MAHTALKDEEIEEFYDSDESINSNVKQIANFIRKYGKDSVVIYTGAGISTSIGINDFRGPNGIWTQQNKIKQGIKIDIPERIIQSTNNTIIPSPTHMAILSLQNNGYLDKVISTNCDGLHIKSGILPSKIIELHGNCNIEACPNCGKVYYRSKPVDLDGFDRSRAIITGRYCDFCNSLLRRTDVAFGQSLPDIALRNAISTSKNAKVVIVLGTSLRVSPACELPFKNRNAKKCIVNLQKNTL